MLIFLLLSVYFKNCCCNSSPHVESGNQKISLFRTNGHSSVNDRSEVILNVPSLNAAASTAGHSHLEHRSEHSSMREHYDRLANERAQSLAEASLLKA